VPAAAAPDRRPKNHSGKQKKHIPNIYINQTYRNQTYIGEKYKLLH
jgi:hypothetical protein